MPVPDNSAGRLSVEESVRLAVSYAAPAALSIREIERASHQDPELVTIRRCISSGNWATLPPAYKQVRLELTTVGRVVLRGTQIVIPASLRSQVVDLAHEGHQGITKMKARLRTKVWSPEFGDWLLLFRVWKTWQDADYAPFRGGQLPSEWSADSR